MFANTSVTDFCNNKKEISGSFFKHIFSYDLTNHLGNVLVEFNDKKVPVDGTTVDGNADYYRADVVGARDYYPFGMQMPGRNFNSSEYRFGFNGQEKDDEITGVTGAHTTAMFWEYDTRIGRRWNLDPKPQISISDYACFANNPILYNDPLGDEFDPASQEKVNKHKDYTQSRIAKFELDRLSLSKQISKKGMTESRQSELNMINTTIDELNTSLNEISILEASNQMYSIKEKESGGSVTYDSQKNIVNINLAISEKASGFAHELKHAFQFENKEMSFMPPKSGKGDWLGGLLYDKFDEIEAYQREFAYNKFTPYFTNYGITSFSDIDNDWLSNFPKYTRPFLSNGINFLTDIYQIYQLHGINLGDKYKGVPAYIYIKNNNGNGLNEKIK